MLTIADYRRLSDSRSIVDWLQMDADIDFEPAPLVSLPQAAEL